MIRDRKFLDWLRDQPCAVSEAPPPCDPAHTFKSTGGGGTAFKSCDSFALPLSPYQHRQQSGMSEVKYWRERLLRYGPLLSRARAAYKEYFPAAEYFTRDQVKEDDILVKHLVQALAHIRYYRKYIQEKRS